jgi:hypothetical protein
VSGTRPRRIAPKGEDWLRGHRTGRDRPWALEQQLLAPLEASDRDRRLVALAARILQERVEIDRMQDQLEERMAHLAAMEEEVRSLVLRQNNEGARDHAHAASSPARRTSVELGQPHVADELSGWLHRCHGFDVERGDHSVGIVEGVRYGSSTSRPDLIEVRAGWFGRKLVLVSVDEVEDVLGEEETLVLRSSSPAQDDLMHTLLAKVRGKRRHQVAT